MFLLNYWLDFAVTVIVLEVYAHFVILRYGRCGGKKKDENSFGQTELNKPGSIDVASFIFPARLIPSDARVDADKSGEMILHPY